MNVKIRGQTETESGGNQVRPKEIEGESVQDAVSHVYGYEDPKYNPSLTWLNAFSLSLSACLTNSLYMPDKAKLDLPSL